MKLKTVIVDDEFPAIQLIREYCRNMANIEVVSIFTKALEAFEYLKENKIDILLLDIQMPVMSGIDVLKRLPQKPMCIFITANPEYAVKAYELDVIDYLVKPVSFERFKKSVEKASEYYHYKINDSKAIADKRYLMVKADYKIAKIDTADISFIEGSGEYVKIVTAEKTILALDSLTNYIETVLPDGFIRIHKSFIVPLAKISEFTSTS
ncbi:MAG: response regulator transcription factor, partial [Rhizobacter sp.]|nr:response regulator transcription factor [Ferruginibacter sp.]